MLDSEGILRKRKLIHFNLNQKRVRFIFFLFSHNENIYVYVLSSMGVESERAF